MDLIKFIELVVSNGNISEADRELIFKKSKELGIPEDVCQIVLEGILLKANVKNNAYKKKDSGMESQKILTTDQSILERCSNLLSKINSLIEPIMTNPKIVNDKFIKWMKDLKNSMELKEDKYNKGTMIFIHKDHYNYGQMSAGEIPLYKPSKIKLQDKEIIGQFSTNRGKNYLLTENSFIQFYIEHKTGWFKSSTQIFTYPEESIDSIDIFKNKEHQTLFRYFYSEFFDQGNVFSKRELLEDFKLEYDGKEINEILENITDTSEFNVVYKVNVEIKKIILNLNDYLNSLDVPILLPERIYNRNLFSPYYNPQGFETTISINHTFFKQLEILNLKIKFLTGVISLRNDFVNSIVLGNTKKIKLLKIKLDELGLLMNFYETNSLKKLDEIINVVSKGFSELKEIMNEVVNQLDKLDSLNEINDNLDEIKKSHEFSNLINLIQTYQVYKINKNTKSLGD